MNARRSSPRPLPAALSACALAAVLLAGAAPAAADPGLRLVLEPSVALRHRELPLNLQSAPAPAPALDLSVHWPTSRAQGSAFELIAGRQLDGLGLQPAIPGFANIKREPISLRELNFIGVQFQGGARLTLRKRGNGLGLTYRATF